MLRLDMSDTQVVRSVVAKVVYVVATKQHE